MSATPTYRTTGNAKHWQTPGYKNESTLGGAFEKAGLSDWALRAWMVLITLGTIFYIYHGA